MFKLNEDEDVAVLTYHGQFGGIWGKTYEDVISNADTIHEMMCHVVKEDEFNKGYWVWIFKDHFSYVEGCQL